MFNVPEEHRITKHRTMSSDSSFGNNGAFRIPIANGLIAWCIASSGYGFEHVSVHLTTRSGIPLRRGPSWPEMCRIKEMFWTDEDTVIQYHPAKKDYVNQHETTLHLWRPIDQDLPIPDPSLIGMK